MTRRWISLSDLASLAGAGLIISGLHRMDSGDRFPGKLALFPTVGTFLLIAAAPETLVNRYILSFSPGGLRRPDQLPAKKMAEKASELGIEYISPTKTLSDTDGCLTMVPDAPDISMSWDAAHFTREGSRYFVDQIADKLFTAPGRSATAPNDAVTR